MFQKLIKFIVNPSYRFDILRARGYYDELPDDEYLKRVFKSRVGYDLNLSNPITFNEKIQWLKLHDRNPEYVKLVDKKEVKEWVAKVVGSEYVIPTLGCWDSFEEIGFDELPNRFVLKCTHDSGGVVLVEDKTNFDEAAARKKLTRSLNKNYFLSGREWPYKEIKPRIIAEEFLNSPASDLVDYKFMCFNGEVKYAFTCSNRSMGDLRVDFFDANWNHLPFERHYPNSDSAILPPISLDRMIDAAEKLSYRIPFVRVDFYEVSGRPLFGEMTFYPGSGFEEFTPVEWDEIIGACLNLDWVKNRNSYMERN